MRLCRYITESGAPGVGVYEDRGVLDAGALLRTAGHSDASIGDDLVSCLPPDGRWYQALSEALASGDAFADTLLVTAHDSVRLLAPVPRPPKLFLLAGNYSEHILEGGERAVERDATYPYVFMKPPSTTIRDPGAHVAIPDVSPKEIDWEAELAVVIGRGGRGISEAEALGHAAGYTVINDLSDRNFRPNPGRTERPRDKFFDWLHGKWHDGFCPMGPCVLSAASCPDPQDLEIELRVGDTVHQSASTAQQIFPVAAVIEFISSFVTLEPGDVISTGTPSGVGKAKGVFLKPGDIVVASIDRIGRLETRITDPASSPTARGG